MKDVDSHLNIEQWHEVATFQRFSTTSHTDQIPLTCEDCGNTSLFLYLPNIKSYNQELPGMIFPPCSVSAHRRVKRRSSADMVS